MIEAVSRAPLWVWGVLAGLCVLGLMLARDRRRAAWLAMLPSFAFALYSGWGVFSGFSAPLLAIGAWLAGFSLPLLAVRSSLAPAIRQLVEKPTGIIPIPGSFAPLGLFLAIFSTRYTLNALRAVRPDLLALTSTIVLLAGLLGLLSGTLVARTLRDIGRAV